MKLYLSYVIGSIALISLASQAFSVKPKNTYDAKEITPSTSSSSNSLMKPPSLSKRRPPVPPFFFQEAFSRSLMSASSSRTPEPISFSPSISPGSCSGGMVFIFEMPKIPEVSLVRQALPSPEEASKIHVHFDLNHMEVEPKD